MPKKAISLTLDESNLLWLNGRARVVAGGSLSEAVDQLIAEARSGRLGAAEPSRSVVGTIDLPEDEELRKGAKDVSAWFRRSLSRPLFAPADRPRARTSRSSPKRKA
ncbi:MAG: hypothetical protein AB1635_19675 [Acidobacteriota bacterium]